MRARSAPQYLTSGSKYHCQPPIQPIDLAVLDVVLPDLGGFALCRERDLPVTFLTAHDAEAERMANRLSGKPRFGGPFFWRLQ